MSGDRLRLAASRRRHACYQVALSDAVAVAYVETEREDGTVKWGVGMDESILTASLRAVVSAVNRHRADTEVVERHEP